MNTYPQKDRHAHSGSNLRGRPLLNYRQKLLRKKRQIRERLALEYSRQFKKLFSQTDLRRAAAIATQIKTEWRKSTVKVAGDSAKIDALKLTARRKLDRSFGKALPNYRKLKSVRNSFEREYRRLTAGIDAIVNGMQVEWDGVVAPADPPPKEFKPPFKLFEVDLIDDGRHVTSDQSMVAEASGQLANHLTFHHRDDPAAIIGLFGLIRSEVSTSLVSCGAAFTMPRAGRLRIGAVVQSFASSIKLSITDNWGFSAATLTVTLKLFVDVVRGNDIIHLPSVMLTKTLSSDGDDKSYTMPDLDNSAPYALAGTTLESFPATEEMWIMIGSEVSIESEVDDMSTDVNALAWWRVQKMTVEVIS